MPTKNLYTNRLVITGGDNDPKTVMSSKPDGWKACDVLVEFATGADGTLSVWFVYNDADGNPISVPVAAGISAGQRIQVPTPAPDQITAERDSSSTGNVILGVLRTSYR